MGLRTALASVVGYVLIGVALALAVLATLIGLVGLLVDLICHGGLC